MILPRRPATHPGAAASCGRKPPYKTRRSYLFAHTVLSPGALDPRRFRPLTQGGQGFQHRPLGCSLWAVLALRPRAAFAPHKSRPRGAIWGAPADEPAGVPLCPRRRCSLTQNSQGLTMQARLSPSCGQSPHVYRRAFPGVRRACAEMLEHLLFAAGWQRRKSPLAATRGAQASAAWSREGESNPRPRLGRPVYSPLYYPCAWCWRRASNPHPADYKSAAQPFVLRQHIARPRRASFTFFLSAVLK